MVELIEARICASEDLSDGGPGFRFRVSIRSRQAPAFVVRYRGGVYGYLNECAHKAVELDWEEGHFFDAEGRHLICATHGALYEPVSGACAGGRCGRLGLTALPVVERDGQIFLATSNELHLL